MCCACIKRRALKVAGSITPVQRAFLARSLESHWHVATEKRKCQERSYAIMTIRAIAMECGSKRWMKTCDILCNLPLSGVDVGLLFLPTSPSVPTWYGVSAG